MIERLTQNTINGLRSEYVYGINTTILNTCTTLHFFLKIVLYMSTKRLATTIRLSVGTSQDEIVIEESVDQIELSSEMKEIYTSLSHILLISIRCRDEQGMSEHVCCICEVKAKDKLTIICRKYLMGSGCRQEQAGKITPLLHLAQPFQLISNPTPLLVTPLFIRLHVLTAGGNLFSVLCLNSIMSFSHVAVLSCRCTSFNATSRIFQLTDRIDSHCSEVILTLRPKSSTLEVLQFILPQEITLLPVLPLSPSVSLYLSSPCNCND